MVIKEIRYMNSPDVSVIVPIYGVERFIERCARSLMEQTLKEVEFIFVDDATTDGSMKVLKDVLNQYSERQSQVSILHHAHNQGLPSARNTGLAAARGEYVVHIDGDDFAEPTMLENLYSAVKKDNADFAWSDYYITFGNKKRLLKQPSFETVEDAVRGMLRGSMKYNVWNKICRRSLYIDNDITFPEGHAMGEDLTMIMVVLHARKCVYVGKPLYNYVQSEGQMTAVYDEKKLSALRFNCERLQRYMARLLPDGQWASENAALCQLMKWPFLLDGKYSSYKRWQQWFPESNAYIWQTKGVNTRIKLVEWCASNHLYPFIWLHYILVIKMFYGIVYRG